MQLIHDDMFFLGSLVCGPPTGGGGRETKVLVLGPEKKVIPVCVYVYVYMFF